MEKFIKYKRFEETLDKNELQTFLDDLIAGGWEIIYYNEDILLDAYTGFSRLKIIILAGKKQSNVL